MHWKVTRDWQKLEEAQALKRTHWIRLHLDDYSSCGPQRIKKWQY